MIHKKLSALISLVIIYLCQSGTALAYSSSPIDSVSDFLMVIIIMAVIFGLGYWLVISLFNAVEIAGYVFTSGHNVTPFDNKKEPTVW